MESEKLPTQTLRRETVPQDAIHGKLTSEFSFCFEAPQKPGQIPRTGTVHISVGGFLTKEALRLIVDHLLAQIQHLPET